MTLLGTQDPALTQALSARPVQAPPLPSMRPIQHQGLHLLGILLTKAGHSKKPNTWSPSGQDQRRAKILCSSRFLIVFSCSLLFSKTHRFPSFPSWQEPKNPATCSVCRIPPAGSHSASASKLLDMGNSHFLILPLVNCVRTLFFLIKTKYLNFVIINFTGTLESWIHRRPRTELRGKLTYPPSPFLLQRALSMHWVPESHHRELWKLSSYSQVSLQDGVKRSKAHLSVISSSTPYICPLQFSPLSELLACTLPWLSVLTCFTATSLSFLLHPNHHRQSDHPKVSSRHGTLLL